MVQFDYKKRLGKNTHKIKIYIDSLLRCVNAHDKPSHYFHKTREHTFVYGCEALDALAMGKGMSSVSA